MSSVQDSDVDLLLQRDCATRDLDIDYSSSSSTGSASASIDGGDDRSNMSSGVSTPTGGTPPPSGLLSAALDGAKNRGGLREGGLMVPRDGRAEVSRSPSPAGLIPIHKSWGRLVCFSLFSEYLVRLFRC